MRNFHYHRQDYLNPSSDRRKNGYLYLLNKGWRLIHNFSLGISFFVNIILVILIYSLFKFPSFSDRVLCSTWDVTDATKKVVYIEGKEATGSGFWIEPNVVLTNNHVVNYNDDLKIIDEYGGERLATVIATDTVRDLALLEVNGEPMEPLEWSTSGVGLADRVYAIGYPGDVSLTITEGIVSAYIKDPYDDRNYIQTDSAINPGNSGGPLVDKCGRVVGVNTFTLLDSENIGFAIDYEQVQKRAGELLAASKNATPEERIKQYPSEQGEVVAKYYDLLYAGKLDKAHDYYSAARKERLPFENWQKGFANTVFIQFKAVEATTTPNVIKVNFLTTERDTATYGWITKEFAGEWTLVRENNAWKMDQSNIKDITKPDANPAASPIQDNRSRAY